MSVARHAGVQLLGFILLQCSSVSGSPGVGRNTLFLSSRALCFIVVFVRDLIVSSNSSMDELEGLRANRAADCVFWAVAGVGGGVGYLWGRFRPPVFWCWPLRGSVSVMVLCCYLFLLSYLYF